MVKEVALYNLSEEEDMRMYTLHHTWGRLCVGYGMSEARGVPAEWGELDAYFYSKFLGFMILNRGFYPVHAAWLQNYHQDFAEMMAVYNGHANWVGGQWRMSAHGPNDRPVQDFVDEHDGRALLILLLCCNPRNRGRVTSQKSLVVYSRSTLTPRTMENRRSRQLLHVPGRGDFIGTTDQKKLYQIAAELGYTSSLLTPRPGCTQLLLPFAVQV